MTSIKNNLTGAVIIGRNEGQRLLSCLDSLLDHIEHIIYVDSGSSDTSLQEATARGVECLSLDMMLPFTAARARNKGAEYLIQRYPNLKYIQFVDGDCEIRSEWMGKAQHFLEEDSQYAVVCGRRRERFPEQSIYNQLCDIEWNTPIGDAMACGGDALIRIDSFKQVKGYRDGLIAGEEPEMCFRLRKNGWKIYRLDAEMTLHDAAMTKVSQWWSRAKRAGHAYAEGCYLHGHSTERFKVKPVLSIILWSTVLPVLIIVMSFLEWKLLFAFAVYPIQVFRLTVKNLRTISLYKNSFYYAMSNVFGKFPQLFGMIRFVWNKWRGRHGMLIEYK